MGRLLLVVLEFTYRKLDTEPLFVNKNLWQDCLDRRQLEQLVRRLSRRHRRRRTTPGEAAQAVVTVGRWQRQIVVGMPRAAPVAPLGFPVRPRAAPVQLTTPPFPRQLRMRVVGYA